MRIGFRFIEPNVQIFVCPGDLEFSLTIPEEKLRTLDGRTIVGNFLLGLWLMPGIIIPYGEIECLLDQLDAVYS